MTAMAKSKKPSSSTTERGDELLRDMLITQLGLARVPQATIRDIVDATLDELTK
jgi:hypothetical protein